MADLKITDLGAALSVGDSNVTVLDDGTSTMKVTMNQLKEYSIGTTDISGIGNGTATGAISSVNTSKNNVRDSIAPTETSTASRAYEVDEKMYISDALYKAKRNIALGDPLVSGTNITPANDVSTEIIELKSDASEAIDSVKNIIAPVEDGGTAVLSYSAGDQFIHLGALCKAKTTINAGDTFIINTNYEDAGQVVDQLDSVKQALTNEVATRATLGAHNLIVVNLAELKTVNTPANWVGNVFTVGTAPNAITFTVNDDMSITLNGTAPMNIYFTVKGANQPLKKGNYKLTGCPANGSASTYLLYVTNVTTSDSYFDYGNGVSFNIASDVTNASVTIKIMNGQTFNNAIFKPMICLASDSNAAYERGAMTNQQLTEITKYEKLAEQNANALTASTWGYTGISFTLTKASLVSVTDFWNNASVYGLAVGGNTVNTDGFYVVNDTAITSAKNIVAFLTAGTWYVWAKHSGAGVNKILVEKIYEVG